MKWDSWVISVAGTLWGAAIQVWDMIIANTDTPWQTTGNWNKLNTNIAYVAEDQANKETSGLDTSTTKYPCNNVVKVAVDWKLNTSGGTMAGKITTAGSSEVAKTYTPWSGIQTVIIDCAVNNIHEVQGNSAGTAIYFAVSNVTNSQVFMVALTQWAVASTVAGWFATIRWDGGSTPTLPPANKRITLGFRRTWTNTYDWFIIGQNI
jgi:hypothetical protein